MQSIKTYKNLCIYGLGKAFDNVFSIISKKYEVNILSDDNITKLRKFDSIYKHVKPAQLEETQDLFVIVTTSFQNYLIIKKFLDQKGIPNCIFNEVIELNYIYPIVKLNNIKDKYEDHLGNKIFINSKSKFNDNCYIFFGKEGSAIISKNNILKIDRNCSCTGSLEIKFNGQNSQINIQNNTWINLLKIQAGSENNITIGSKCTFENVFIITGESGFVKIGNDCMFSHNIELWQTDGHPIFDSTTGKRINSGKNITIKDHVWVGAHVHILGGASIGKGSIIGARSITSSEFHEEDVVIVGNPAKIIRRDIKWQKDEIAIKQISDISETINYSIFKNIKNILLLGDYLISNNSWENILKKYNSSLIKYELMTTQDIINLLEPLIHYKPSIVILNVGNCDFLLDQFNEVDSVFERYKSLFFSLQKVGILIIPLTSLEINSNKFSNINMKIKDLNIKIINYLNVLNHRFIDVNAILKLIQINNNNQTYQNDDFNLTQYAYQLIENAILSEIQLICTDEMLISG